MTTETKPTEEQLKQLDKLHFKFFISSMLNAVYHALLLVAFNVVTTLAVLALELPEFFMYAGALVAGIFVFRRMLSITKESHDRLTLEVKKIYDSK